MIQKQWHRRRKAQGTQKVRDWQKRERDYQKAMFAWLDRKPSSIHFIQRIIWRQREPRRTDF